MSRWPPVGPGGLVLLDRPVAASIVTITAFTHPQIEAARRSRSGEGTCTARRPPSACGPADAPSRTPHTSPPSSPTPRRSQALRACGPGRPCTPTLAGGGAAPLFLERGGGGAPPAAGGAGGPRGPRVGGDVFSAGGAGPPPVSGL